METEIKPSRVTMRKVMAALVGVGGMYLGSWAAIVHESAWWSYPTLMLGIIMFAGGIVQLIFSGADAGVTRSETR